MTHPAIHYAATVPPPDPSLEAARAHRHELVHRPMRLDPQLGAVPDLSAEDWGWLRRYRVNDARMRRSSR